tara:strand:- start:591 stop:956 length:366 start_codon:yes stop_codon:yes gene_type:complete
MRTYLVHVIPNTDPILLKDGFSFMAFVFSGFWALWHRMWFVSAMIFGGWGLLEFLLTFTGAVNELRLVMTMGFSLIVGFGAHDWLSSSLLRRGYSLGGLVVAPRLDAALRRWFDQYSFAGR